MDEPAPKEGAGTDESHRTGSCCGRQDSPGGTPLVRGNVRASSSNAHQYQLSVRESTGLTRTQYRHLADPPIGADQLARGVQVSRGDSLWLECGYFPRANPLADKWQFQGFRQSNISTHNDDIAGNVQQAAISLLKTKGHCEVGL